MNKLTKNILTVGILVTCAFITHKAVAQVDEFSMSARCASFASQLDNKEVVKVHMSLAKLGLSRDDFMYQYGIAAGVVITFAIVNKVDQVTASRNLYKEAKCLSLLPSLT